MVGEPNTIPAETTQTAAAQPAPATPEATLATGEPKKSIFKKWWLWAIIIIIIALGVGAYFLL